MFDVSCRNETAKPRAFRVGIHDSAREFRLKVEGPVGLPEALEVESCWRTAESTAGTRAFVVDLYRTVAVEDAALGILRRLLPAARIVGPDEIVARLTGRTAAKTAPERCFSLLCRLARVVVAPVVCWMRRLRRPVRTVGQSGRSGGGREGSRRPAPKGS